MGSCHPTSVAQEHKSIRYAGPERDTIFQLHATELSLGSFTGAGDFVLQLIRLGSLGSELEES